MAVRSLTPLVTQIRQLAGAPALPTTTDRELLERFVANKDQAAFEALVRRHGKLVLSACRQVLSDPADIDDAFQATFLTLLLRADSVRWQPSIGNWLFGAAHRIAVQARANAARRRQREARAAAVKERVAPPLDLSWREAVGVLHEELERLPDRFRLPLLLCYLQGKSRDEAAEQLGWTAGSLRGRLERGREELRKRLVRRGITLGATLLGALGNSSAASALPPRLVQATLRAATAGDVPAAVAALTTGVSTMLGSKIKLTAALVLCVAMMTGIAAHRAPAPLSASPPVGEAARFAADVGRSEPLRLRAAPANEQADKLSIRGRVLDPDGKPVPRAKVFLQANDKIKQRVTTGDDGRFRLTLTRADLGRTVIVVATAKGHGPDWAVLRDADKEAELTLRLAKDDVPVTGQILDLEGRPVAGATVQAVRAGKAATSARGTPRPGTAGADARATRVVQPAGGDLASWVEQNVKWLASHTNYAWESGLTYVPARLAGMAVAVTTDKDGRFRLTGVGRDRAVVLDVHGPGIERRRIWVVTLPNPPKELSGAVGLYGPAFKHLAGPAKPAAGTVTDRETGKPLAGIRVVGRVARMGYARGGAIEAVTDEKGNYRLEGLPKSDEYFITVDTLPGLTYLPQEKTLGDTEGIKPLRADFALARGTLVEGRLLDQDTGRPVRGRVCYYPLPGNEHFPRNWFRGEMAISVVASHPVGDDGSFKLLVFPGPGVVCADGDHDTYLPAPVAKEDAESGVGRNALHEYEEVHWIRQVSGHAYHVIRPGNKPEALKFDLKLVKGRSVTGSLSAAAKVGPGIQAAEFRRNGAYDLPIRVAIDEKSGTFTATGLDPHRPNLMVFYHEGQKLAGHVEPFGDAKAPVAVRLQAWGKVRGRVLDPGGRPAAGATVQVFCRDGGGQLREFRTGPLSKRVSCDGEGRFQVEGLVPGLQFELNVRVADGPARGEKPVLSQKVPGGPTKPGQMNDIGDVKIAAPPKD